MKTPKTLSIRTRPYPTSRGWKFQLAALMIAFLAATSGVFAQTADEEAVKAAVVRFLTAVGDGDLEALPGMFVEDANIGAVWPIEGGWATKTQSFVGWHKNRKPGQRFSEPVSHFTVHIEEGQLAFVRAEATYVVDGHVGAHNVDYFTLVRDDSTWKFVNASYITKPAEK